MGRLREGTFWRVLRGFCDVSFLSASLPRQKLDVRAELTPCREIMSTVVAVGHRRASTIDLPGKILASYYTFAKCEDTDQSPVVQFTEFPRERPHLPLLLQRIKRRRARYLVSSICLLF